MANVDDTFATPGSDVQPLTPGSGFDREKANRLLDEAFEAAVTVKDRLRSGMADRLAPINSLCAELQAKQRGTIGIALDRLSTLCQKVEKKVQGRIGQQLGTVYGYMQAAGLPIPTAEQAHYYATTKDLGGALGIADVTTAPVDGTTTPDISGEVSPVTPGSVQPQPTTVPVQPANGGTYSPVPPTTGGPINSPARRQPGRYTSNNPVGFLAPR
jgi:hypothetical protein